ncbi:very short patch repair endonuclease [Cellulosimicrobium sp. NPDC055967]|uniref:very short patch repair endonuclease n=1 Tax=Cellulosimicrobium sp. NPDC055967 TaxID=3345670 RepID=UPI0035D5E079
MGEQWKSTSSSAVLSGRRNRDTAPEVALRRALHARGVRFRLQRRLAPSCTPDIVLPSRHVAVWVDGCYWDSCPQHGRRSPFTGPNAALWEAKMTRTRARDAAATETAQSLGWTVVRVWEHEVTSDRGAAAQTVLDACDRRST